MRRGASGINVLLAVDKPCGKSSHDVVNVVRRALKERRVGHAGTLDPAARGVLVVGVGQGTRLMGMLTADYKSYVARIVFGSETTTDDAEGEVRISVATPCCVADEAYAREVLATFLGVQDQVPPSYSAISVDGKRSYARARAGEDFTLEARHIEVKDALLLGVDVGEHAGEVVWNCAFVVSKGTYIRALARDIGRRVEGAAHLQELCRTASGDITLAQCTSLDTICELGPQGIQSVALDPVSALGIPVHKISNSEEKAVACGRRIAANGIAAGQRVAMVKEGLLWGVWESNGTHLVACANFAQGISGVG